MIKVRPSRARGATNIGWLDSKFSFSFANYYDPANMGFGPLRVINEDVIAPGGGFDTHGHSDMEIITYVLEGALAHRDSLGNGSQIRPGDVQRMTAGTGIRHSEFNASQEAPVHLLQIWILPETRGLTPGYEEKAFPTEDRKNRLRLIASRDGREGSVLIHQDASLFDSLLEGGASASFEPAPGRLGWLQVIRGDITLNGIKLGAGDGAAISDEQRLTLEGQSAQSEFLLFDLPH